MRGSCLLLVTWLSAALLTGPVVAGGDSACDNHACFSGVKQWCQGVCPFDPLNFGALCATTCAAAAGNASSCLNSSNDTTGQALLDTLDVLAPTCAVLGAYTQTTLTPCKNDTVDDSPCAAVQDGAPCSQGCRDALNMINSDCRGYLATLIYYVAIPSHVSLGVLQTCGIGPFPNLNGGHPIPSMLPWITSEDNAPAPTPALAPPPTPSPARASIEGVQSPAPAPTDTFSSSMSDKKPSRASSSLSAGVIAAIVVAALMCVLVLVLLALFLVQRRRQGTNTPSLIPGLALGSKARQGKGGPAGGSTRGRNLKALGRTPRNDSFSLDANPSGFAHLMRDSESHSTASPQSQSELPVAGSGLSAQTSAFGVKGGAAGGSGAPHIWSNASTQDWFLGANPAVGAPDPRAEKPWFSEVARLSPFPPPESMLEASQMEMYRHGVPGLGNQNSEALGHAVSIAQSRQLEGVPMEGDDGMNWDLQPDQVQPCRTADGRPVILGTGAYGNVYKGILNGVTEVAIKVLHNDMDLPRFRQEISILKRCRDNNIVNYLGAFRQAGRTMLVTEFMGQGNLFKALQTHRRDATLRWRSRGHDIALNVARGLVYMHGCSPRVIHFDLKSPNILLSSDGTAKIADVGLSRVLSQTHLSNPRFVGTFAWAAPELLTGTRCSELVDVYSFGVVMWELITGEQPERGCLRALRVPEECPEAVEELMDQCLLPTPEQRPSALQVYERLLALQQNPNSPVALQQNHTSPAVGAPSSFGFGAPQDHLSDTSSAAFSAHHLPAPQIGQARTVPASPFQQRQGSLQNQRGASSLPSPFAPQDSSTPNSAGATPPSSFPSSSTPETSYQPLQHPGAGYASTLASPFQQATSSSRNPGPTRQQSSAAASPSPFAQQSQQQQRQQSSLAGASPFAASTMQYASPPLSAIPESAGGYSSAADPASRISSAAEPSAPPFSSSQHQHQQQQLLTQQLPAGGWSNGPAVGYPPTGPSRLPLRQSNMPQTAPDAMSHRKTMSM